MLQYGITQRKALHEILDYLEGVVTKKSLNRVWSTFILA